jgi:hypothetical protein
MRTVLRRVGDVSLKIAESGRDALESASGTVEITVEITRCEALHVDIRAARKSLVNGRNAFVARLRVSVYSLAKGNGER